MLGSCSAIALLSVPTPAPSSERPIATMLLVRARHVAKAPPVAITMANAIASPRTDGSPSAVAPAFHANQRDASSANGTPRIMGLGSTRRVGPTRGLAEGEVRQRLPEYCRREARRAEISDGPEWPVLCLPCQIGRAHV